MAAPERGTPTWLVNRLYKKLMNRRAVTENRWNYYIGKQPLPVLHKRQLTSEYERLLKNSQMNVCNLIADAVLQRMSVDGFRVSGSDETDDEAWRIWQANHLDADFELVLREMLATGYSYAMVWPNPDDESTPIITPESCHDTIVMRDQGNRRKLLAALRVWRDEMSGDIFANLYTPEYIYKYSSKYDDTYHATDGSVERKWEQRSVDGESWPEVNPLGIVPIVEFVNRPDMYGNGVSEFEQALKIQDRLNKDLADLAIIVEYGAFKQKWATGYDIPEDEDGQPMDTVQSAISRMMVGPSTETKFGEFSASDPGPVLEVVKNDMLQALSVTQTPPHTVIGSMVNIGAETLKEAGAALIAKVWSRNRFTGESLEEVIRLALRASGQDADERMETVWHNPETFTLAERADAAVKYKSLGLPVRKILEIDGYTQQEIDRVMNMRAEEQSIEGFGDPTRLLEE